LSKTNYTVRIDGVLGEKFNTTIGTPQGDGLSPLLFVVYLDDAFKHYVLQKNLVLGPLQQIICYADDSDLINFDNPLIDLPELFGQYNLQINPDKTEIYNINRANCKEVHIKKLGSKLNSMDDMNYRIASCIGGFRRMYNIWRNNTISLETKLRLYNACIIPLLMYNLHCDAFTKKQLDKINAVQTKQLRIILKIFYPNKISNIGLYNITKQVPISILLIKRRWNLFGHMLRKQDNCPFNIIMNYYYHMGDNKPLFNESDRRYVRTSIPECLNNELVLLNNDYWRDLIDEAHINYRPKKELLSSNTFQFLKLLAQNRNQWNEIIRMIINKSVEIYFNVLIDRRNKRRLRMNNNIINGFQNGINIVNNNIVINNHNNHNNNNININNMMNAVFPGHIIRNEDIIDINNHWII
jgi:hypothetical protein